MHVFIIADQNILNRVKRHKNRQSAGRPKKEAAIAGERAKKELLLTVEPSVNCDGDVKKVCIIRK